MCLYFTVLAQYTDRHRILQCEHGTIHFIWLSLTAVHGRPRTGILLAAATLLTAGVVGTVGAVGYVGLLAAHLARQRLVFSAFFGAVLLLAADLAARMLTPALPSLGLISEVPVGVVTTLIGIPWCIVLLAGQIWQRRAFSGLRGRYG